MKKKVLLMVGLVMLMGAAAQAELITIAIEAQVTEVDDTYGFLQGQINVDDLITGYYRYDPDAPDAKPDNDKVGTYLYSEAPFGIYLSAGGFIFQTDQSNVDFLLGISNGQSGGTDAYVLASYNNLPLYEGVWVGHINWQLNDDSETAVSSDALPTTPPILTDWPDTWVGLTFSGGAFSGGGEERGSSYFIRSTVTSAVLVPEPITFLLLGFGGLALRRKQHR